MVSEICNYSINNIDLQRKLLKATKGENMTKKISIIILVMAMLLAVGGFTTSTAVSAKNKKVKCLGTYKITAYCGCRSCSGSWGNRTASGRRARQGRTISVDRRKIKLGTKVRINGHVYVAEDTGSKVRGKHIDMYFSSHHRVRRFGKKYLKVYKIE